ncbi:flagellar filament capping protein FliD [Butyrivibrio sp. WCD2001]|uniref:flagellar filament capping protein FliD n=1 Tax=Butyrivibrio sp. WCD2001 TaxID=1280681 RepID=UPI0003FC84BB|nr:flagellar filament capping protein FliD [Butyrivibrio sp. WCD2001]
MTMRITGLASGLDTESIITELTKVQSNKVDKIKSDQKKHDMKMDKWKELNKKVVNFYNKTLSNLRFDSSFVKKTTTVSDESAVTVTTSGNAMNSNQKLSVNKLASSAYLTGGKVTSKSGDLKATTSITNLTGYSSTPGIHKPAVLDEEGNETTPAVTDNDYKGIVRVRFGKAPAEGEEDTREFVDIKIDADKSITEALAEFKEAKSASGYGLNASFDAKQGRVYISSSESGEDQNFDIDFDHSDMRIVSAMGLDYGTNEDAVHNAGEDAEITLNGAVYKSNSNTFDINGLSITAKQVASDISLQTSDDTSGIYDMVKGFLKEYNELMGEMYTLYNADDAKDYAILTKEQKDEMTDDEIEDWNKKIDEGLLSRDPTIFRVMNEMKNVMMQSFDWGELDYNEEKAEWVEVKTSFWSFHIATPGYFEGEEADRMKWHIYGDEDDELTSGKEDKLKAKIEKDPEIVCKFFKTIASDMYSKLGDLMKSTDFSSAYTLYEDKQMKKQVDTYKTQLKDAQDKLGKMEDNYYNKFAQMEKAMTKLNEQTNSLAGMLGTG